MKRYRGVLFVSRESLTRLGGGAGALRDARLAGDKIVVDWAEGRTTTVDWPAVRKQTGLPLPPPTLAFVSQGDALGLLFESNAPCPSLQFVEPHSLVFPLGWLTLQGLRTP